jgi:hypothetical protein
MTRYIVATDTKTHTASQQATLYMSEDYRNRYIRVAAGTFENVQRLADQLNGEEESA